MPEYDGILRGLPANLNADRITIAVGSTNLAGDTPFQFSAYGSSSSNVHSPEVDVVAPGVDVLTTLHTGTDHYDEVTTVTASAGIAGGVASLLKSNNPDLKPDDIREILRRTADPMGAGTYDPKTGFGRINAQAALQYLQDNTITHGVIENPTVTKVQSNQQKTLIKGAWGDLASGTYYEVDVYEIKGTVDLPSGQEDVWYRAKGTTGWSLANPNFQRRFAVVDVDEANKKATITTFVYHIKYNSVPDFIDAWRPVHKDVAEIAYTLAGDPVPPPPPPPPATPTLSGSVVSGNPHLSWTASGGADHYKLTRTSDHPSVSNATFTTTNLSYTDYLPFDVELGTSFEESIFYFVQAVDAHDQESDSSNVIVYKEKGGGFGFLKPAGPELPQEFALSQNYPNPFNPSTTITYDLPERSALRMDVYNMLGQRVAVLINGPVEAGSHQVVFDASALASGTYFLQMEAVGESGEVFRRTLTLTLAK